MKALRGTTTDQKMVALRDKLFKEFDDAKRQLKEQYTLEFGLMRAEYRTALEQTKRYHRDEIEKLKTSLSKQKELNENEKQRCQQQVEARRRFSQDVSYCRTCLSNGKVDNQVATSGQIKEVIEEYERQLGICRKTINDQKLAYENALVEERNKLQDAFAEEKMAFEELAFKQLNLKLEKQLKWRDLLLLEQGILSTACENVGGSQKNNDADMGQKEEFMNNSKVDGKIDDDFSLLRQAMLDSFTTEMKHVEKSHKQSMDELKVNLTREGQRTVMRERKIHKRTIEQLKIDFELLNSENRKLKELLQEHHSEKSLAVELTDVTFDMKQELFSLQEMLRHGEITPRLEDEFTNGLLL